MNNSWRINVQRVTSIRHTCILLFLSASKFRRIYSNVTIRPAARGLSG
jgi:hypothetical protein